MNKEELLELLKESDGFKEMVLEIVEEQLGDLIKIREYNEENIFNN